LRFENSTKILDDIINFQRLPLIKTSLGFDKSQMNTKEYSKATEPPKKVNEGKSKSYAEVLKRSISDEDNRKRENDVPQKIDIPPKDNTDKFKISFPPRWHRTTRYQNSFLGYFFSCNHFGHKAIDCRAYARNYHVWNKKKVLMSSQIETIIHFLHYLTTMLYVISVTTMCTYHVFVEVA
jgi:hypothetical protein